MIRLAALGLAASLLARPRRRAFRIARISRVVADLDRTEAFYRDTLGFDVLSRGVVDPAVLSALKAGPANEVVLRLGGLQVALVRFASTGKAYPPDSRSDDAWFQHLAIVVADIDAAYAHLCRHAGWTPISDGGPVQLPAANGAVRAFKFRDPDRHPLELIWFPAIDEAALFARIDHSALAARCSARSVGFYRSLGFRVSARSFNHGPAQARLDGFPAARARITSLRPAAAHSAGLEILAYRPPGRPAQAWRTEDGVTDWVTVAAVGVPAATALRDPDGHRLVLVPEPACP